MFRDVVFIIGPHGPRDEFQYALRSLSLLPHRDVWIIGHKPEWVQNVAHYPYVEPRKWWALHDGFKLIADIGDLSDEVVYSEDDYFIVRPVEDIPNYYRGTLAEKVKRADVENRHGGWSNSLRDTLANLRNNGFPDPLSFDVHIPMVVDRETIPLNFDDRSNPLRWRDLVGAVSHRPPVEVGLDVKHTTPAELSAGLKVTPGFLSSNERTFASSGVRAYLQQLFPDPSPYEV
jgi:hypothetical protein